MKKLFFSALLGALALPVFAIPSPIPSASELPEFDQFDVNITVPSWADRTIYQFNPKTVGILTVLSNSNGDMHLFVSTIYNKSDYTVIGGQYTGNFLEDVPTGYKYGYEYNLTPDNTYYISIPATNYDPATDVKFLWEETEAGEYEIDYILPEPSEGYFDYLNTQNIVVQADGPISSFGTVTISYNDVVETIVGNRKAGPSDHQFLTVAIADPGSPNYAGNAANAGATSFTITIKDYNVNGVPVTGNATDNSLVTVDNGTVTLKYNLTKAATYLPEQSTWPATIYSNYEKGDMNGIATLVFDQPIASVGVATMTMAAIELGSEGGETPAWTWDLPTSVDGNKIYVDFTGKDYSEDTDVVTVIISDVKGTNGLPAALNGFSTIMAKQIPFLDQPSPDAPNIPSTPPTTDTPDATLEATLLSPTLMAGDPIAAVELQWPEEVSIVNAETLSLPVTFNGEAIGNLSSTYVQLLPSGPSEPSAPLTRAETGDKGTLMFLLVGGAEMLDGEGTYTVTLPEGIVENGDGDVNKLQVITFTVVGGVVGEVTPESGTAFEDGEDVIIVITFDGPVEQEYSLDAPVYVSNYLDGENAYEENLNWAPNVVYIEGNTVVINLGSELPEATYYLSLREGVVSVEGTPNAAISDYIFVVTSGYDGVSSIEAETAKGAVYNLNGVQVDPSNLKPGIYVVNGKKVLVK